MAVSEKELEEQLTEAGKRLLSPPSSVDELLPLLDELQCCLERVEQSPSKSTLDALSPSINALVANKLLGHLDPDVKVSVATCISEITRITAPDAPYDDNQMKEIFKLIVSSFEKLYDKSNRSYNKRASILETVAKVRSCLLMLDLECDALIIEMFQHFLKSVRDNHPEDIFQSMEAIMTLVLEESEDICPELLSSILLYLKRNNEDVQPIAQKLAEKVLVKCAKKVKPYLLQASKLLRISLNDYKDVVTNVCQASGAVELNNLSKHEAHDTLEDSDGTKIPSNSDKKVDVQHPSSKTSRRKTMNVPSTSPTGQQPEECHPNKVGRRKKKESLIHQSTPEHVASKKEDESISGLDTKSTKQFHQKDESVGSEQGEKRRRGKGKSILQKDLTKTSSEDKAKECGTPPKSSAKSVKSLTMSSKKKHTASGEKASQTEENGENFVGSKIKVWWPDDEMFYEGLVDSFDHVKKKHKIIYADGDVEVLNLKKEKWELITGDADSVKGNTNDDGNGDTSSETHMKKAKRNPDSLNNEEKSEQSPQKGVGGAASKRRRKNRIETKVDKKSEDGSSRKTGLVDEDEGGKTPVDVETPLGSTKKRKQEISNKSKKSNSNGSVVKGKGQRTKKGKKSSGETGKGTSGTKSGRKRPRAS